MTQVSIANFLFSPEFRQNPFPIYQELLRDEHAVSLVPMGEPSHTWTQTIVSRHEHVSALLRDPRLVRENPHNTWTPPENWREWFAMINNWMLFRDPPAHTRLRGLVNKAFTPQAVAQLRGSIEATANELLDGITNRSDQNRNRDVDLISQYAFELPVLVIANLLGVPAQDRGRFHEWSRVLAEAIDFNDNGTVLEQASQAAREMHDYLLGLIAQKRTNPTNDILTSLVQAEDNGDRLSTDELIATCALLLFAGHETTVNLIGNGTLALLQHPDQLDLLRRKPALLPNAIEEMLRYNGPVQATARMLAEEIQIDGITLPAWSEVTLLLGAANHDPRQFAEPERFDITRNDIKHLTFGGGIHYCVGAPLARLEGQIGIGALLHRSADLRLRTDEPLEWRGLMVLRGLNALPVTI